MNYPWWQYYSYQVASVSLLAWLSIVGVLDARVIDDFNTGHYVLLGANATINHTQSGLDPEHVVGGSRFISFRSFATPPSVLSVAGTAGTLDVSPGNCCTYLTVRYGDSNAPLQLNLLDDGSDRFRIDFAGLTHEIPSSMPTIFARDNQGRIATIVSGSSATIQPVAPFSLIVPFNQFPSFDWTNIQSIEITVSRYGGGIGAAGKSFTLDKIVTIPEPAGSVAIWIGLATALMTFFRRIHG